MFSTPGGSRVDPHRQRSYDASRRFPSRWSAPSVEIRHLDPYRPILKPEKVFLGKAGVVTAMVVLMMIAPLLFMG